MRLVLNIATRGRPHALVNTILKTAAAIRQHDTVIMVSADDDDQGTLDAISSLRCPIHVSTRPREDTVAAKWNRALDEIPDADVYLPMADHTAFVTPDFDGMICAMASLWPDGIGLVVNQTRHFHCSKVQAVTRKLANAMGHIFVEHFPYWFADVWLFDIAKMIDRFAFLPIEISKPRDYPTQGTREMEWWARFYNSHSLVMERRAIAIDIVQGRIQEPGWRKAITVSRWPLYEDQTGRMVAAYTEFQGDPPTDARYLRVKESAIERMGKAMEAP